MIGAIRTGTQKASFLSREVGPANWYVAPLGLDGKPFRFPWSADLLRKIIRSSLRASPNVDPLYAFNSSKFLTSSLDQPLIVAAPADLVELAESMEMMPEQSGGHTAELTSNAALVEPIDSLKLDTDTESLVS